MKYFFILIFIILTSCSLNKNSTYWTGDSVEKPIENTMTLSLPSFKKKNEINNLSKFLKKNKDINSMTFDEFRLFLKKYSDIKNYPNINN